MRMFHGTTDAFADSLTIAGLAAHPPARTSAANGDIGARLVAYPGVYFAVSEETAAFHAGRAAATFGGDPIMVEAEIERAMCHPDEDEVLFVLQGLLTCAMEEREGADGLTGLVAWDGRFRMALARRGVVMIEAAFDPDVLDRVRAAALLDSMLLAGAVAMIPSAADMVGGDGWLSQEWALAATRNGRGLAAWRANLDALCRCVVGPRPTEDTCGEEAFKVRVPFNVGYEGACRILSIGPLRQVAAAPRL